MKAWMLHGMRLLVACWLGIGLGHAAHAMTWSVQEVRMLSGQPPGGQTVALPHFIEQEHLGLHTVRWQVQLPAQLAQAHMPALLLPQPVQGFRIRLRDQLIYELAPSDEQTFRTWYAPALVALPKALIDPRGGEVLEFEQTGHLRGWFIAPMQLGEFNSLRPLSDGYAFISQTLKIAVVLVCGVWGVFLLVVGTKSRSRLHTAGGWIAVLWSAMIGIAFIVQIPSDYAFLWRLSLYLMTGWVIYFEILFNCAIYPRPMRPAYRYGLLAYLNAGGAAFAVLGWQAEAFLDTVWTSGAVLTYMACVLWVIGVGVARRDWQRAIPIALFLVVSMVFSQHDQALLNGTLPIRMPTEASALWPNLLALPVNLIHLLLPIFIALTLWLVGKEHITLTRSQWLHERQLSQARERMVTDIHDGVGARINLLIWSMRTRPPEPSHIAQELQACMDELRFAINPPTSGQQTLHKALDTLVHRLAAVAPADVHIAYQYAGPDAAQVPTDAGLQLYKAANECLSNALRHSGATQIGVRLERRAGEIAVTVQDNGQGIPDWDNALQQQTQRRSTSLGLVGLQQRMQQRGGRCQIESSAQGTCVRLTVPVMDGELPGLSAPQT